MYWNDVVTIYHKSIDESGVVSWINTSYTGCFWRERSGAAPNSGAHLGTATRLARIPETAVVSSGDIAVFGYVSDPIDDYTQGQRLTDFRKKHPKSFIVSTLRDNAGWGRPMPHICIEGA